MSVADPRSRTRREGPPPSGEGELSDGSSVAPEGLWVTKASRAERPGDNTRLDEAGWRKVLRTDNGENTTPDGALSLALKREHHEIDSGTEAFIAKLGSGCLQPEPLSAALEAGVRRGPDPPASAPVRGASLRPGSDAKPGAVPTRAGKSEYRPPAGAPPAECALTTHRTVKDVE